MSVLHFGLWEELSYIKVCIKNNPDAKERRKQLARLQVVKELLLSLENDLNS